MWRNNYQFLQIGYPPFFIYECLDCLKQKYGINVVRAAGCRIDHAIFEFALGYDSVMNEQFKAKYGQDFEGLLMNCQDSLLNSPELGSDGGRGDRD